MLKGRKHLWCGKVNWDENDVCTCPAFNWSLEMKRKHPDSTLYEDVVFDNPMMENFAVKLKRVLTDIGIKGVSIDFDPDHENDWSEKVGCVIIDGWLYAYPESIEYEGIDERISHPGIALDAQYVVYNYPNEPDDVAVSRLTAARSDNFVISRIVKEIVENRLNNILTWIDTEDK